MSYYLLCHSVLSEESHPLLRFLKEPALSETTRFLVSLGMTIEVFEMTFCAF